MTSIRRRPLPRSRALLIALITAGVVVACEDPFVPRASFTNQQGNFTVWALTGTPDELPSAMRISRSEIVLPDPAGSFDIAFDLNATDQLVVLPVRNVVTPILGAQEVLFLRMLAGYDQITEAPKLGYSADSAFITDVGDVFMVKVVGPACQFDFRKEIYAKFEVESIIPSERRARLRFKVNPNCGFRSLADGIPEF